MLCLNMRMVQFLKKSALLTEQKAEQGPNLNSVVLFDLADILQSKVFTGSI